MNRKMVAVVVVGIFLSATFGSVSACDGGCLVNKKKEYNSSNIKK